MLGLGEGLMFPQEIPPLDIEFGGLYYSLPASSISYSVSATSAVKRGVLLGDILKIHLFKTGDKSIGFCLESRTDHIAYLVSVWCFQGLDELIGNIYIFAL